MISKLRPFSAFFDFFLFASFFTFCRPPSFSFFEYSPFKKGKLLLYPHFLPLPPPSTPGFILVYFGCQIKPRCVRSPISFCFLPGKSPFCISTIFLLWSYRRRHLRERAPTPLLACLLLNVHLSRLPRASSDKSGNVVSNLLLLFIMFFMLVIEMRMTILVVRDFTVVAFMLVLQRFIS